MVTKVWIVSVIDIGGEDFGAEEHDIDGAGQLWQAEGLGGDRSSWENTVNSSGAIGVWRRGVEERDTARSAPAVAEAMETPVKLNQIKIQCQNSKGFFLGLRFLPLPLLFSDC